MDLVEALVKATQDEFNDWNWYQEMADQASRDGLDALADSLRQIAADEHRHRVLLGELSIQLERGTEGKEAGLSAPYYARAEAPFDYVKAAGYIIQNVPSIVPEYVGEQLAESKAPIDSWLQGMDRSKALDKRGAAMRWIRSTAEQHGYQGD